MDVVLALDAYTAGQAAGRVALVTVGAALLRTGLRQRASGRATHGPAPVPGPAVDDRWAFIGAPAPATAMAPSAPAAADAGVAAAFDFFSPPPAAATDAASPPSPWSPAGTAPAPARRGGLPLVLTGAALISAAVLSFLLQWTPLGGARVELPPQVLGLQKDLAASAAGQDAVDAMSGHVPGGMPDDLEIGLYGTLPAAVLVMAADEGSRDPQNDLASVPTSLATRYALDGGTQVEPGSRPGAARCWNGQQQGQPVVLCAFVDRETTVVVIDFTGNDLATSSDAARAVREAVVR